VKGTVKTGPVPLPIAARLLWLRHRIVASVAA
jgi:hypothetical protein